jgi:hypothetical protein
MEAKHAQIVTGPQSWSGLVEEGGPDAVQARLEEFWQDTVDGGPLEKATSYYRRPGPFQRDALAIARFRRSFAARYYRDSLAPTLKTYFQRKAEDAQIELATETNRHCDRLLQALEELSALKAAVDWARVELEAGTSAAPKPASAGGVTESVLLVLDASGSMKNGGRMEKAKQSAARIVERLGGETEVALIVFYDCRNVVVEQSFTTDRRALTAALAPVRPSGSTPLAKAVAFADHYLAKNAASERQKLIVLTDGKETCGGDPIAVAGNLPTR